MELAMDIIGWCGTILVVASMLMTSMKKLRLVNIIGSTLSVIFCVYTANVQVAVMNGCLVGINFYRLIQQIRQEKTAEN